MSVAIRVAPLPSPKAGSRASSRDYETSSNISGLSAATSKVKKNKVSLVVLLAVMFVLLVATALFGWLFTYSTGLDNVDKMLITLQQSVEQSVVDEIARVTQKMQAALSMGVAVLQDELLTQPAGPILTQATHALSYFWSVVESFPEIMSVFCGVHDGGILLRNRKDGTDRWRWVDHTTNFTYHEVYTDSRFPLDNKEGWIQTGKQFDARVRSWYKGSVAAGKQSWVRVYHSLSLLGLALPAAVPIYFAPSEGNPNDVKAVIVAITSLVWLDNFLTVRMKELGGTTAKCMLVDAGTGYLLSSTPGGLSTAVADGTENVAGTVTQVPGEKAQDYQLATVGQAVLSKFGSWDKVRTFSSEILLSTEEGASDEQRYLYSADVITDPFDLHWVIVMLFAEDHFVGELNAKNDLVFAIVVTCIAVTTAISMVSVITVTKGIRTIVDSLDSVCRLDLATRRKVTKGGLVCKEVAQLDAATSRMYSALGSFSKFVPVGIIQGLLRKDAIAGTGFKKCTITVMFMDMVGFTTLVEELELWDLSHLMSVWLDAATAILGKHGTIDKYIGDCIMVFYNQPVAVKDHVNVCLSDVLRCITEISGPVNDSLAQTGLPAIKVRTGINTGVAIVGNVGTQERLNYTALGDTVNLAARFEPLNKLFGTTVLITQAVHDALDQRMFMTRRLGKVLVAGKKVPSDVYEVMDWGLDQPADGSPVTPVQLQTAALAALYTKALTAFETGDYKDGEKLLNEILQTTGPGPDDMASKQLLLRCQRKEEPVQVLEKM